MPILMRRYLTPREADHRLTSDHSVVELSRAITRLQRRKREVPARLTALQDSKNRLLSASAASPETDQEILEASSAELRAAAEVLRTAIARCEEEGGCGGPERATATAKVAKMLTIAIIKERVALKMTTLAPIVAKNNPGAPSRAAALADQLTAAAINDDELNWTSLEQAMDHAFSPSKSTSAARFADHALEVGSMSVEDDAFEVGESHKASRRAPAPATPESETSTNKVASRLAMSSLAEAKAVAWSLQDGEDAQLQA